MASNALVFTFCFFVFFPSVEKELRRRPIRMVSNMEVAVSDSGGMLRTGEVLSLDDCRCPVCLEIFMEPVTLPCTHTFCKVIHTNTRSECYHWGGFYLQSLFALIVTSPDAGLRNADWGQEVIFYWRRSLANSYWTDLVTNDSFYGVS